MSTPPQQPGALRTARSDPPLWPEEGCPSWCVRTHRAGDHREDRMHSGEGERVLGWWAAGVLAHDRDAGSLVLRLVQPAGDAQVWVEVTPEEGPGPSLLVTAETARGLSSAIARLLG